MFREHFKFLLDMGYRERSTINAALAIPKISGKASAI
jgi:hypothetical protein